MDYFTRALFDKLKVENEDISKKIGNVQVSRRKRALPNAVNLFKGISAFQFNQFWLQPNNQNDPEFSNKSSKVHIQNLVMLFKKLNNFSSKSKGNAKLISDIVDSLGEEYRAIPSRTVHSLLTKIKDVAGQIIDLESDKKKDIARELNSVIKSGTDLESIIQLISKYISPESIVTLRQKSLGVNERANYRLSGSSSIDSGYSEHVLSPNTTKVLGPFVNGGITSFSARIRS